MRSYSWTKAGRLGSNMDEARGNKLKRWSVLKNMKLYASNMPRHLDEFGNLCFVRQASSSNDFHIRNPEGWRGVQLPAPSMTTLFTSSSLLTDLMAIGRLIEHAMSKFRMDIDNAANSIQVCICQVATIDSRSRSRHVLPCQNTPSPPPCDGGRPRECIAPRLPQTAY